MPRIFIITEDSDKAKRLSLGLSQAGFACWTTAKGSDLFKQVAEQSPDIILITLNNQSDDGNPREVVRKIKQEKSLPVVALVDKKSLTDASALDINDFIVEPPDINELIVRINRLLQGASRAETSDSIKSGDLLIDVARCEVTFKGRPIQLTFKEYELLKFLASNRGRVFSRDAILNRVWGYDYYGGDRTVDVHIRRLRSKIEESTDQTFIETVRNIGYRFKGA